MSDALIAMLPIAVAAIVASIPVVAMSAVLVTLNSRAVLAAFVAGTVAGLLSASLVALVAVDGVTLVADSPVWLVWLRMLLGLALVGLAVRKFLGRARPGEAVTTPAWVGSMSTIGRKKAFGVAFLLGSVNPKNVLIVVSTVSAVVYATSAVGAQVLTMVVFSVIASLGVAAPLIAVLVAGDRVQRPLTTFVSWFARYSNVVMSVVLLLLGLYVLLNALGEL